MLYSDINPMRPFVMAGILSITSMPVTAQQSINLDTIVVTGTKTERKLRDVPVRTEVISQQQLEKTHARDLVQALHHQPGVLLKKIHGKSGYEVFLQGVSGNRVLVLIDGRPVSASTGSTVDLSQLSVNDVKQIEIVKGAVSALHGSSAIGGVINIITQQPEAGFNYKIVADTGSWADKNFDSESDLSERHLALSASWKEQNWHASVFTDIRDSDGFDLDHSTFTSEGDSGEKSNLKLELGYRPDETSQLTYRPSYYTEDIQKNLGTFTPGIGIIEKTKNEDVTRTSHSVFYEKDFEGDVSFLANIVVEDFIDKTNQDVNTTAEIEDKRNAQIDLQKLDAQLNLPLGDNQIITTGLVLFRNELNQTKDGVAENLPDLDYENVELFIQDDIFVGENWELLPGIRVQDDSLFGFHAAAKINALYSPVWSQDFDTKIRLGMGQGYRVPDLKERGYIFDHRGLGYVVLGSQILEWDGVVFTDSSASEPEESKSFQAGIELINETNYRFDFSVFYNSIKNLIDTDRYDGDGVASLDYAVYRYVNIAKVRTKGVDITYSKFLSKAVVLDLSYGYLDAIDKTTGNDLQKRPDHQVKLGFDWSLPDNKSQVSVNASWQSEEFTSSTNDIESPSYSSLDLKFNYQASQRVKLFAGVDNLSDEHKDPSNAENDLRPERGRFIYAGLMVTGR